MTLEITQISNKFKIILTKKLLMLKDIMIKIVVNVHALYRYFAKNLCLYFLIMNLGHALPLVSTL